MGSSWGVEVTEELRRRVMENVRNADIDSEPKIIRFPNPRRYGAIAVCLALVLTVELKGSSEGYTLACWTDGIYAYSLSLSSKVDVVEWNAIIVGID
ncbi:hypothetical protein SDC9_170474 [bioreactor metagenome]|uniref:Uncharacterized protein n=1 Tax=bioreactor metagenome TaxID=1076179 RepID=A0A645GBC0_9ZZZZ